MKLNLQSSSNKSEVTIHKLGTSVDPEVLWKSPASDQEDDLLHSTTSTGVPIATMWLRILEPRSVAPDLLQR